MAEKGISFQRFFYQFMKYVPRHEIIISIPVSQFKMMLHFPCLHSFKKETQFFRSCLSFGEECILVNLAVLRADSGTGCKGLISERINMSSEVIVSLSPLLRSG